MKEPQSKLHDINKQDFAAFKFLWIPKHGCGSYLMLIHYMFSNLYFFFHEKLETMLAKEKSDNTLTIYLVPNECVGGVGGCLAIVCAGCKWNGCLFRLKWKWLVHSTFVLISYEFCSAK